MLKITKTASWTYAESDNFKIQTRRGEEVTQQWVYRVGRDKSGRVAWVQEIKQATWWNTPTDWSVDLDELL